MWACEIVSDSGALYILTAVMSNNQSSGSDMNMNIDTDGSVYGPQIN